MAEIVGAFGAPHMPQFPEMIAREGPESEAAQLWHEMRQHVEAVDPDVFLVLDSDHLATFFLDNLPTFCVGVSDRTAGPSDATWPLLPRYELKVQEDLGRHLHATGVGAGFDLAVSQEFTVDHSIVVPLHFLNPGMAKPMVPLFINGFAPPLPLAKRCYALGHLVRRAVESWPGPARVAVVASGSFSLEIAGPRSAPGLPYGVPDPEWISSIVNRLDQGQIAELLEEATTERMMDAGNASGELLNWIALMGLIGDRRPRFVQPQLDLGHAFAAWRWDS